MDETELRLDGNAAAGLLSEMDTAPYTVTKHGSVALAEWLAIRHAGSGVRSSRCDMSSRPFDADATS